MTIHIAGLGPGRAELLTVEVRALLTSGMRIILRTRHHPTVAALEPTVAFTDCDDLYRVGASFDRVYEAIVARVLEAGRAGDVVYAVPGHPLVAERTVVELLPRAGSEGIAVRVYPGLSFADAAATTLRCDMATVQLCDALDLRIDAQRPALVSQIHDRDVSTTLKLALLDIYPPDHTIIALASLGTDNESVRPLPLSELDHRPTSHLDAIFVPALPPLEDVRRFDGLHAIVARLHAPDGCPWDREQTHASLRPHLLEEAYETLEAIDAGDPSRLTEELGDVLLQVLMHAAVAARTGDFTLADITEHIARKLLRRHPHVFGEATAKTAEEVWQSWEALKQAEKPRDSILEGVPSSLPALAASQSIQGRARRVGFDWPDLEGPLEKLIEEVQEFALAEGARDREDEFGDILFVLANIALRLGIDAEQALRRANTKFRRRFGAVEEAARNRNMDLAGLDIDGLNALWNQVKAAEDG